MDEEARRQREIQAAMRQIRDFQKGTQPGRFRLDIPVWRLVAESLAVFAIAFVSGLGLAVLYQVFSG